MKKIPTINLPDNIYHRLQKLKDRDGFGEKTWEEWLKYLVRDVHLVEPLTRQIAANTRKTLGQIWMQNLAENLSYVRSEGKTLREIANEEMVDEPAIVVGAGPSIWKNNHLKKLVGFHGKIFATDRMLIPLLEENVKVDYVISVDGNAELIPRFFDHDLVEQHKGEFKVLLVLQTSPKTLETCLNRGLDVYWFHTMQDDPKAEDSSTRSILYMTMSKKNPVGVAAVPSGGNCGATSLAIAIDVFKHKLIGLVGFDFGYPADYPAEKTSYYSTIFSDYNKQTKDAGLASTYAVSSFSHFYHPIFKTEAKSDPVFDGYRASLYEMLENLKRPCRVCNLTEGGTIYNPALLDCLSLDEFLKTLL